MNIIWEEGDCSAKQLAIKAKQLIGWNKTTTYTVKRLSKTFSIIKGKGENICIISLLSLLF